MPPHVRPQNLADSVYSYVKSELFAFKLLPGDRFTETEIAERTGASRTPVRQALYQLEREGFLAVNFRNGWEVRQIDFLQLDAFYELRVLLEQTSVRRMKTLSPEYLNKVHAPLNDIWCVPVSKRCKGAEVVAKMDEAFHCSLVAASGNMEFARVHGEVTEKIRFVRRLDFTVNSRINATYDDHSTMIKALYKGGFKEVENLLATHIEVSRLQARAITLLSLQNARKQQAP